MRQFVPLTDEMLYQMSGLPGPLVPYRAGLECWHALTDETVAPAPAKIDIVEESRATRAASPMAPPATAPGSYTSAASVSP